MLSSFRPCHVVFACLFALLTAATHAESPPPVPSLATTISLLHPRGLVYDAKGNLFFAEAANHLVRRLDPQGNLTTVAGTGVQGFSGDGGPAAQAQLDTPSALALDPAGNLYLADTHNHRIRRVDALTQTITTIAGTGVAGFSGDNAPAVTARLDSPLALTINSGTLYFADSANHRIRRIDLQSGTINTVAGSGIQGFTGDSGSALAADLNTPAGLAVDTFGNLYIADTGNHRLRRVDASTRIISTVASDTSSFRLLRPEDLALSPSGLLIADAATHRVLLLDLSAGTLSTLAGTGAQAFQGDGGPAAAAMLDSPSALALSPSGSIALADTGNQRIRQVATDGSISTVVGLGALLPGSLTLSGATTQSYGATTLVAALSAGSDASSGSVSLLDVTTASTILLSQARLSAKVARFTLPSLTVGTHRLLASFSGSATERAAQSQILSVAISPLPLVAAPTASLTSVYGQPLPPLSATLSGLLASDSTQVAVSATTTALQTSPPGIYPVVFSLQGAAAANYTLVTPSASLTIAKAPVSTSLKQSNGTLTAQVFTSTAGTPSGSITLLTAAGTRLSTLLLNSDGTARISAADLTNGSYSLTAIYSGDADFLSAQSPPLTFVVGTPPVAPDFSFSMASTAPQSINFGATAQFTVTLKTSGSLAGPITLSASALPVGFVANFDPPIIPPGGAVTSFTLSVATPRALSSHTDPARFFSRQRGLRTFAWLSPVLLLGIARTRRRLLIGSLAALALCGCGARINSSASSQAAAVTYPIVITGTTTNLDGSTLQHAITATLTVQ